MSKLTRVVAAAMLLVGCGTAEPGTQECRLPRCAATGDAPPPPPLPPGCSTASLAMKVLVLSADGNEIILPAIQQALDYHSVPYDTWIGSERPGQLVPEALASGCSGSYQGVILTTGELSYSTDGGQTFLSALTESEWEALRTYEARFGVREVSWYVYPGADNGLNPPSGEQDTGTSPISATLTSAGQDAFPYIDAASPIPIERALTYLSTAADPGVTPLLVDGAGHVLLFSRVGPDGRETMALTFASNPSLLHDLVLAHGLVEWVTRGIYLGEYRVYLTPQVDDLYGANALTDGGTYRMTASDVTAVDEWQLAVQGQDGNGDFRLAFAFNGSGSSSADPLTLAIAPVNASYHFINHTWTHPNLDAASYETALAEISRNDDFGTSNFSSYSTAALVTPEISGLANPNVMVAAKDVGVRYMVSDSSLPEWDNPRPNIGIYSTLEPSILFIPRRPTNLFADVSLPASWVDAYNAQYAAFWGRNLTYAEILDEESHSLLFYMLRGDLDPQMYHQANLRAYDGVHSLLSDLHDAALAKLRIHSNLPVESPTMVEVGQKIADTMARNASGLSATLQPGVSLTLTSPVTLTVVVSGVCQAGSDIYAGKCITPVELPAGGTVTLPL